MKWFNNWLLRSLKKAAADAQNQAVEATVDKSYYGNGLGINTSSPISKGSSIEGGEKVIRFNVYSANGGRVIETRRVDRQRDREVTGLYVITNDQDFGHEVDKIITMEALK